jgi:hypothetical protein
METNHVLYQVRAEYFCTCNVFILVDGSLCRGSDGYSPASRPGDPDSISGQSICEIHTGHSGTGKVQHFSRLTVIPPLLHFIFIGVSLLRYRQKREVWDLQNQPCCVTCRGDGQRSTLTAKLKTLN